jgi:single-strand DNA-binding protein
MASLNRVILIGNLTRDPEMRYTPSGTARTSFSIAINRRYKDQQGQQQEETTFVPITVWGAQAEHCANYLTKGQLVAVDGRLRIYSFQTEEGESRKVTEVVASRVEFLSGRKAGGEGEADTRPAGETVEEESAAPTAEISDQKGEEEIPF